MADNKKFISGASHTGPTPDAPLYVSKADQEQAEREAANRAIPGQHQFDKSLEEMHAYGRADQVAGGVPESVLDYRPIDPTPLPKFSADAVRAMFPPDFDSTSVPAKLASMYGLDRNTHEPQWWYMDGYDNKGTTFEQQYLADNPWDEHCLDKDGKKCYRDGMVLFKRPLEVCDYIRDRFNEVSRALKEEAPAGNPDIDERSPEILKRRDETSKSIQQMLADSPSKHMGAENLERALKTFTPEETSRLTESHRPAWHTRALEENNRDRTAEQLKNAASSRSTHAIGVGFDSNGNVVR